MKHFLVTRGIEPLRIGIVPLGVDPIPHFSLCEETEESCYRYHRIVHLIEYIPPPKAAPVVVRKVLPPPIVRTANLPSAPSGISLLLPAGKLLVENTLMYLHNSASQVGVQTFTVNQLLPRTLVNIQPLNQNYYVDILSLLCGDHLPSRGRGGSPHVYRTLDALVTPVSNGATGSPGSEAASGAGLEISSLAFTTSSTPSRMGGGSSAI